VSCVTALSRRAPYDRCGRGSFPMVALCPGGLRRYPRQRTRPAPQIAAPVHAIIRRMTNCGTPLRVTIESYRSTCRPLAAHSDKAKVATTVDLARDLVSLSRRRSRILCPIRTALRPLSDQTNKRTVPSVIEMRQLAAGVALSVLDDRRVPPPNFVRERWGVVLSEFCEN
jgi:hypothetical protein